MAKEFSLQVSSWVHLCPFVAFYAFQMLSGFVSVQGTNLSFRIQLVVTVLQICIFFFSRGLYGFAIPPQHARAFILPPYLPLTHHPGLRKQKSSLRFFLPSRRLSVFFQPQRPRSDLAMYALRTVNIGFLTAKDAEFFASWRLDLNRKERQASFLFAFFAILCALAVRFFSRKGREAFWRCAP